jgi:soluble lytic murein transglycosylase-like protein
MLTQTIASWAAGTLLVLLSIGAATPAEAQIYSWQDADGTMVYSDRPEPGTAAAPVKSYVVANAAKVRATTYVPPGRGRAFDAIIDEHAKLNGVRPELVRAVVQVESAFNPFARSPKGAMGLMQLMPATAKQFGVMDAYDPVENVRAGVRYLRQLLDRYSNDERLALAAYNAGPGAVDKYGQQVPPYRETQDYVTRIAKIDALEASDTVSKTPATRIFKITETINGREVVRYTDRSPK